MNDAVLGRAGMQCLIEKFGTVEAERFISLIMREPFDYTKWQRDLFKEKSVEEIFAAATQFKVQQSNETVGN